MRAEFKVTHGPWDGQDALSKFGSVFTAPPAPLSPREALVRTAPDAFYEGRIRDFRISCFRATDRLFDLIVERDETLPRDQGSMGIREASDLVWDCVRRALSGVKDVSATVSVVEKSGAGDGVLTAKSSRLGDISRPELFQVGGTAVLAVIIVAFLGGIGALGNVGSLAIGASPVGVAVVYECVRVFRLSGRLRWT